MIQQELASSLQIGDKVRITYTPRIAKDLGVEVEEGIVTSRKDYGPLVGVIYTIRINNTPTVIGSTDLAPEFCTLELIGKEDQ